jgi:retron-type reverse transcriptase
MISFDVVSLFTAIPIDRACEHIRNKLSKDDTLGQRSNLSIDDIIKLLRFTLSNSYFNYNNETYKQIHGCAMGSPVSPIVANLCMEEIEELAFNQTDTPPKKWFRFVDDVFSIIKLGIQG